MNPTNPAFYQSYIKMLKWQSVKFSIAFIFLLPLISVHTFLLFCSPLFAVKSSEWMDRYRLKFLGSVQVPYHKGNDVLCAAMQKVGSPLLSMTVFTCECTSTLVPKKGYFIFVDEVY